MSSGDKMTEKYLIDTVQNKIFLQEQRNKLLEFGKRFPSPEGGSYYLGDDGNPMKDRSRETWITSRMAHSYSIGAMLGRKDDLSLAKAAINGLLSGELADKKNGGWYSGIAADGSVLPSKACYAHAFVILAASSGMLAGIDEAKMLYEKAVSLFMERFWDEKNGLTIDLWDTDFTSPDSYRGLNSNMHTVEALLAASDASGDKNLQKKAGRIIERVAVWAGENGWRIPEHYTEEWEPDLDCNKDKPDDQFKPYGATPGHGIEWARLIIQWATSDSGADCKKYIEVSVNLYNRAKSDAWNADGAKGICYTTDWEGKPVVHDRMHWTLAEAINTSSVLYRVTGRKEFAEDYSEYMEYLDTFVVDHNLGSWFHELDINNIHKADVWPGKPDIYHALQAMTIPYLNPDVSIAKAVQSGAWIADEH